MSPALNRPRAVAAVLIALALLVGVLGGMTLDRWVLHRAAWVHDWHSGDWRLRPADRPAAGRFRSRYVRQLAEELKLTPEQRARVDTLLQRQQERSRAVMQEMAPRLRAITAETESGLQAILTPEQWQRFQELRRRRPDGRRPQPPDQR
jgi:Spy/CpxP family protein refolding chaperone